MVDVAVTQSDDIAEAIDQALSHLTIEPLVRDRLVAVKPMGGKAIETGLVIASTDAVAADTLGAQLLGFEPQGVRHIWEAGKVGLGETDTSRMRFPGLSQQKAIEEFTKRAYGQQLTFQHA